MNKNNETSTSFTTKIKSSLVLKLNLHLISRLISAFLAINVFIIVTVFFISIWKTEEGAQNIIEALKESPHNIELVTKNTKYKVSLDKKPGKGLKISKSIEKRLPISTVDAKRSLRLPENSKEINLLEKINGLSYIVEYEENFFYYHISYPLGEDLQLPIYIFSILLFLELLFLLVSIRKGYKNIRRTLQPIADLAQTAHNLNVASSAAAGGAQLKDLAGAISNIDANKLDSQISVNSSQDELKDLAYAINNMLERINDSYQSQVRFVSDASHELRTPISVIQGYANLLDRWGKNDEKTLQESIDAIKSETGNMKDLVEQLLFLARGDNETIQLHMEAFDCCEIMDEIMRETKMIDNNHVFEVSLDRPAFINADKQLLKQAIRVLMDNSIKYTPPGEKIILKVSKENDNIKIVVQDSGIGIDSENLPKIFDRFYRSDESRARKTGGSGLGLSIAKWIIERHGAYFEILSRVDIGTRITIVFEKANGPINPQD